MITDIGIGINIDQAGFSWSSYWSALISATVEDAAPTDVILTFPSAASLVATDITCTVNGIARVVSSASWTGSVWTVVLASAVIYGDVVVVTFGKTGQTQAVTNNIDHPAVIDDGNSVVWIDAVNPTYIVKDGSDLVSQLTDRTGLGNHLLQSGLDSLKPVWSADGVLLDGTTDYMESGAFLINTANTLYVVLKQVTWSDGEYIFSNSNVYVKQHGITPDIAITSGNAITDKLPLDTFGIIRVIHNGGPSSIQINEETAGTGATGSNTWDKMILGASSGYVGQSNIQVKEIILRKVVDNATIQGLIYGYLKAKYGL